MLTSGQHRQKISGGHVSSHYLLPLMIIFPSHSTLCNPCSWERVIK